MAGYLAGLGILAGVAGLETPEHALPRGGGFNRSAHTAGPNSNPHLYFSRLLVFLLAVLSWCRWPQVGPIWPKLSTSCRQVVHSLSQIGPN